MQTLVFDSGGFKGRLYPNARCFVRRLSLRAAGGDLQHFLTEEDPRNIIIPGEVRATHTYCGRLLFLRSHADTRNRQSPTARGYLSNGGGRMSANALERGA